MTFHLTPNIKYVLCQVDEIVISPEVCLGMEDYPSQGCRAIPNIDDNDQMYLLVVEQMNNLERLYLSLRDKIEI